MTHQTWKDTFEIIGVLSIVASLIFVGLQLGQSEGIGNSEVLGNWTERTSSHFALVTDHADIWQRACAGEQLAPAERTIAAAVFQSYSYHAFSTWWLADNVLIFGLAPREQAANRFAANVWRYPGFRKMLEESNSWNEVGSDFSVTSEVVSEWAAEVQARIELLRSIEPAPEFDTAYCGLI